MRLNDYVLGENNREIQRVLFGEDGLFKYAQEIADRYLFNQWPLL